MEIGKVVLAIRENNRGDNDASYAGRIDSMPRRLCSIWTKDLAARSIEFDPNGTTSIEMQRRLQLSQMLKSVSPAFVRHQLGGSSELTRNSGSGKTKFLISHRHKSSAHMRSMPLMASQMGACQRLPMGNWPDAGVGFFDRRCYAFDEVPTESTTILKVIQVWQSCVF